MGDVVGVEGCGLRPVQVFGPIWGSKRDAEGIQQEIDVKFEKTSPFKYLDICPMILSATPVETSCRATGLAALPTIFVLFCSHPWTMPQAKYASNTIVMG